MVAGKALQQSFFSKLGENIDADSMAHIFRETLEIMNQNMTDHWRKKSKMQILITILVTFFAGMGAGLGTGFAGMSAAAVISPMLITFLHMDPYMAVGIALSSDVLASAVSCLHLRQKQESGHPQRPDHDVQRCWPSRWWAATWPAWCRSTDHGQLLHVYDAAAGREIHRSSPVMTTERGHGSGVTQAKTAIQSLVCGTADRLHLRLCGRWRRHDDAADPDQRCWAMS